MTPESPMRGGASLLRYRPWRGPFLGPWYGAWAIARVGLMQMLRRKLFWMLYAFSLMIFLFFFYGQYLQVWIEQRITEETLRTSGTFFPRTIRPDFVLKLLRDQLRLNGSADTYANFMWFEGFIVVIVLALIGSVLVGNDFHFGSMPFFLSKPIGRKHYIVGKCVAIGVFVNAMTTIPAVVLWIEYGFIDTWDYYVERGFPLLLGILAYGTVLTISLSLLLLTTAIWLRRTVSLVMVWIAIFILGRLLQRWIVDGLRFPEYWRLIDLWNNMYLVGLWCLGVPHHEIRPTSQIQPPYWSAALVVVFVWVACLWYLRKRIQAVEVVS